MLKQLQDAFVVFQFVIPSAVPMLAISLVYSFPGVFQAYRKKCKLHSISQGRLAIAEMASFIMCIVGLFIFSFWFAGHPESYSAEMLEYIRTRLGSSIAMMSFCICMLIFLITLWPVKKPSNKE